jgi:four helix bundle protein
MVGTAVPGCSAHHRTERNMTIQDFRDLVVWQRSIDLAEEVYKVTRRFPKEELFGMTAQVRKSSVSVSSNIAEGSGRATTKDLLNFLSTARGSLRETQSLLILSQRLRFLTQAQLQRAFELIQETGKMLTSLRRKLKNRKPK